MAADKTPQYQITSLPSAPSISNDPARVLDRAAHHRLLALVALDQNVDRILLLQPLAKMGLQGLVAAAI